MDVFIVVIAMKRRQFVKGASGIIAIASLAGCTGSDDGTVVTGGNGDNSGSNENNKDTKEKKAKQSKKQTTQKSKKKVKVLSHELFEKEYSAGVKGQIKNVSGTELGYVEVKVRFFDAENTRLGESLDNFTELGAGTTANFKAVYLGQDSGKIDHYELETSASSY